MYLDNTRHWDSTFDGDVTVSVTVRLTQHMLSTFMLPRRLPACGRGTLDTRTLRSARVFWIIDFDNTKYQVTYYSL
jgi:hypothetical protein